MKVKFEIMAKVVIAGREDWEEQDAKCLTFKLWTKNETKRIYINDYRRRTIGYFEDGEFHLIDKQGLYENEINETIKRFMEKYEF